MNELLSLVLGWFLGIAGTLGVERYKDSKQKKRFLTGLRVEFARLQGNMAVFYWNLTDREGAITREDIEWVLSRTRLATEDEGVRKFRANFTRAQSFSDADIAALRQVGQQRKQLAVSLRTYHVPFLEANLPQIVSIEDSQIVANIFNVRQQLNMFNEIVADTRGWHQLTFDASLTSENHQKVLTLVEGGYAALRNRAKWTADAIESVLQEVLVG